MIVSTSRNFIYARVPKTASTSVSAALQPYARPSDTALIGKIGRRMFPRSLHPRLVNFQAHAHWPLLAAKIVLGDAAFDRAFRFTVVRHPVARALSYYHHILRHADDPGFQAAYPDLLHGAFDFEAFADSLLANPVPSQMALLVDYDGNPICNAAIRVERLPTEFAPVLDRLGIAAELPALNVGGYGKHKPFSDKAVSAIEQVFRVDYEQFGYGRDDIAAEPKLRRTEATEEAGALLKKQGAIRFTPWERARA